LGVGVYARVFEEYRGELFTLTPVHPAVTGRVQRDQVLLRVGSQMAAKIQCGAPQGSTACRTIGTSNHRGGGSAGAGSRKTGGLAARVRLSGESFLRHVLTQVFEEPAVRGAEPQSIRVVARGDSADRMATLTIRRFDEKTKKRLRMHFAMCYSRACSRLLLLKLS